MANRHELAGRIAARTRHHGSGDPQLANLRRDLAAEKIADHIRRIVADAPPLTAEQRDKIASLLRPALKSPAA